MARFFWLYAFGGVVCARLAQLFALYFMDAPMGGPIVDRWYRFFPHAFVVETGYIALFTLGVALLDLRCYKRKFLVPTLWVILSFLYLALSGGNDELMRWLGQHITWGYLRTYVFTQTDPDMVARLFAGGALHFGMSLLLVGAYAVGMVLWVRRFQAKRLPLHGNRFSLVVLLMLAGVGVSSQHWFAPSKSRWERIQPVAYTLCSDLLYGLQHSQKPVEYSMGISFMGGDPSKEFPFWKPVSDSADGLRSFLAAPDSLKPDVVMLVIESLRGWSGDLRVGASCSLMPHICGLAQRGAFFPNTHSVGFPSVEGLVGLQLGIWSHPQKMTLVNRLHMPMRSLPDILGEAGYYRELITATEPSFDNLNPWFQKWFDYFEYRPENNHDVPLANRFAALYAQRPANQPMYLNWYSTTTHVPFTMPQGYGPDPDSMADRYKKVLAYMDSAVGLVLQAVEQHGRPQQTVFVLTGDHSMPHRMQNVLADSLGPIHDGHTWVPLIIAGPRVVAHMDSMPASHADVAPTLLGLLQLSTSHHFMGHDLFSPSTNRSVWSFRQKGIQYKTGSLSLYAHMEDSLLRATGGDLQPQWDTTHLAEGFVQGTPQPVSSNMRILADSIRAAALAWSYILDQHKLKPQE